MQVEHMKEFLVVARAGNISAASEQLYLAQPVLSKHIRALEKEVGADLLNRTTRGVTLTPLGEEAARVFDRIVSMYDEFKASALLHEEATGTIQVGILTLGFNRYVLPVMSQLKKWYPKVNIVYSTEKPTDLKESLINGTLDVILGDESLIDSSYLSGVLLRSEPISLVVATSNPLATKEAVTPDELSDIPLVCLKKQDTTPYMNQLLAENGIKPKEVVGIDELELVPIYVAATNGFFAIPEFMQEKFSVMSNIAIVKPTVPVSENLYYIYNTANTNPILTVWLRLVRQLAENKQFI